MSHGAASFNSQAPQARQCRASISRASVRTTAVGELPHISTDIGGCRAISLIGPMTLPLQNSAPLRSRFTHASIKSSAKPQSNFGSDIRAPQSLSLDNSKLFFIGSNALPFVLVKAGSALQRQPAVKRGYVGSVQTDCLRHDDYRSADFSGPMVAA